MRATRLIPWAGLAAMLAEALLIVVTPVAGAAYWATQGAAEGAPPPFVSAMRSRLGPLLTFGAPDVVYHTYGKVFAPIILGFLFGLLALHARQSARTGRLERWSFRMLLAGLALLSIGACLEYWVGAALGSQTIIDVSFVAFAVPGFLLTLFGSPLFGSATLRAGIAPKLGAWLLILGGFPLGIGLAFVLGHLSSALLLFGLGWMVIGHWLWSEKSATKPATPAGFGQTRRTAV
ncbi:MAG: hypothetical protein M3Q65_19130 [Chloroflexota bacterium]|nr:hypothetical protein [Chloroflexota bacterium]